MDAKRWIVGTLAVVAVTGCGHMFPAGEQLLPETYGPPFGSALKDNLPHHPHNPASDERHAASDPEESRTYRSHAACHAALTATVARHGQSGRIVRLSSIESVGHYEAKGEVHEHRCHDYVLSHRSWCASGSDGGGHGEAHKKGEGACDGETAHH